MNESETRAEYIDPKLKYQIFLLVVSNKKIISL